jgi:hypothetical protein
MRIRSFARSFGPSRTLADTNFECAMLFARRCRQQVVQFGLAPISGVPVNNAALGGLIYRRDKGTNLTRIRLFGRAGTLVRGTQMRDNATISKRSTESLSGALGC